MLSRATPADDSNVTEQRFIVLSFTSKYTQLLHVYTTFLTRDKGLPSRVSEIITLRVQKVFFRSRNVV